MEQNLCERCGRTTMVLVFASLDNKLVCGKCREPQPRVDRRAEDRREVRVAEPARNAPASH